MRIDNVSLYSNGSDIVTETNSTIHWGVDHFFYLSFDVDEDLDPNNYWVVFKASNDPPNVKYLTVLSKMSGFPEQAVATLQNRSVSVEIKLSRADLSNMSLLSYSDLHYRINLLYSESVLSQVVTQGKLIVKHDSNIYIDPDDYVIGGNLIAVLSGVFNLTGSSDVATGLVNLAVRELSGVFSIPSSLDIATGVVTQVLVNTLDGDFMLSDSEDVAGGVVVVAPPSLTLSGGWNVSGSNDAASGVVTTNIVSTLTIDNPINNQIFQYEKGLDGGVAVIKGSYSPSNINPVIEVKYGTSPWMSIGTGSGGVIDLTVTLDAGQAPLLIRPLNDSSKEITRQTGVGNVIWAVGDSMMSGRFLESATSIGYDKTTLPSDRQFDLVFLADDGEVRVYDPTGDNGHKYLDYASSNANAESDTIATKNHFESIAHNLVNAYGMPVMMCVMAKGGSTAGDWLGTLYNISLTAYQGLHTKVAFVAAHIGTNETLQGISSGVFQTNLINMVGKFNTDFQADVLVAELQQVPANPTLASQIRQVLDTQIGSLDGLYSGGDLSGITPETGAQGGDNIHFKTDLTGVSVVSIWTDAIREYLDGVGEMSGSFLLTGSSDDANGVVTTPTNTVWVIDGDFLLTGASDSANGVVTPEVVLSTLYNNLVTAWTLDDVTTLQDVVGSNDLVQTGGSLSYTTEGADFSSNTDPTNPTYLSAGRVGVPELDFSGKSFTIAFQVKINVNTSNSDDDENYLRVWDFSGGSNGVFTIDRKADSGFRLYVTPLNSTARGYIDWARGTANQPFYRPAVGMEVAVLLRVTPGQIRIRCVDINDTSEVLEFTENHSRWDNGVDDVTEDLVIGYWNTGSTSSSVRNVRSTIRNYCVWHRALTDAETLEYCTFTP